MNFVLHDRMSKFLKSTALSPPRREREGFDLLDLVIVDPHAEDPAKLLLPTETNLLSHFAKKQKIHRHNRATSPASPNDAKRVSKESFELTTELESAIGIKGVDAHANGTNSSGANVNLVISNEKSYSISGATFSKVETMVKDNFRAIVKNAARFHMDRDRHWYDYYKGKNVYYIAVITKVYHGSISIEESDSVQFGAGLGSKVKGVWEFLTEGSRSESNSKTHASQGIVGVQLLCFPFRKTDQVGIYDVLQPIHIVWMDESDRRKLQRAYKQRDGWSTVESQGDGSINVSARRGFLSDCKATVTSRVTTAVAHAKQEFKTRDFRLVKSILMTMIALVLFLPILGSVSTNIPTFHVNALGPRQIYAAERVLNETITDITTLLLRLAFSSSS